VRVSEEEIRAISEYRKLPEEDFRASDVREEAGELLLRERENGDCVLFENGRCSVHPVKPKQCRLYPFWFRNVRSGEAWARTCRECPGIGEGEWVSPEEILRQVHEDLEEKSNVQHPTSNVQHGTFNIVGG
jgi:Fe-S-cluster containining protein